MKQLTPYEEQICTLVRQGHSDKTIATMLGVASGTISNYVNQILKHTGMESRQQLAAIYQQPNRIQENLDTLNLLKLQLKNQLIAVNAEIACLEQTQRNQLARTNDVHIK